jgi:hypothetical protein
MYWWRDSDHDLTASLRSKLDWNPEYGADLVKLHDEVERQAKGNHNSFKARNLLKRKITETSRTSTNVETIRNSRGNKMFKRKSITQDNRFAESKTHKQLNK